MATLTRWILGTNRRQLIDAHGRILDAQIADQVAHMRWQRTAISSSRRGGSGTEQAGHAVPFEAVSLALDGAGRLLGLLCPFTSGLAEQHNRTDQFVSMLSRPLELELQLVPILSWLHARSLGTWHRRCHHFR